MSIIKDQISEVERLLTLYPNYTFEQKEELQHLCAARIDTTWHFSLYWDRSDSGWLSTKGWEQARQDCEDRIDGLTEELNRLREIYTKLKTVAKVEELKDDLEKLYNSLPD